MICPRCGSSIRRVSPRRVVSPSNGMRSNAWNCSTRGSRTSRSRLPAPRTVGRMTGRLCHGPGARGSARRPGMRRGDPGDGLQGLALRAQLAADDVGAGRQRAQLLHRAPGAGSCLRPQSVVRVTRSASMCAAPCGCARRPARACSISSVRTSMTPTATRLSAGSWRRRSASSISRHAKSSTYSSTVDAEVVRQDLAIAAGGHALELVAPRVAHAEVPRACARRATRAGHRAVDDRRRPTRSPSRPTGTASTRRGPRAGCAGSRPRPARRSRRGTRRRARATARSDP